MKNVGKGHNKASENRWWGQSKLSETIFILFKVFQLCQLIKQVFSVQKSALFCSN